MADTSSNSNKGTNSASKPTGTNSHPAAATTTPATSGLRAAAPTFQLTPSQIVRSNSTGGGPKSGNKSPPTTDGSHPAGKNKGNGEQNMNDGDNNNDKNNSGRPSRNRRRNNRQGGQRTAPVDRELTPGRTDGPRDSKSHENDGAAAGSQKATSVNSPRANDGTRSQDAATKRRRKGGGGNKPPSATGGNLAEGAQKQEAFSGNKARNDNSNGGSSSANNNRKKNNKLKKKYPWRRFIPKGTVDPITLENLQSLEYPPFALCADKPYLPVPVWPIPVDSNDDEARNSAVKPSVEELNRQRLAEQWGSSRLPIDLETDPKIDGADTNRPSIPMSERPLNLYDGQALAYYLVSQLQFIDPLNRRDLTRPELVNLDQYLKRHGFTDVNVTEAYDAKGITLSTAGAAATTAQGRADILQQMAQQLLNSLFSGHSVSNRTGQGSGGGSDAAATTTRRQQPGSFSLQEQYAAMLRQEQAQQYRGEQVANAAPRAFGDPAFYGSAEAGGFMVIDDDENPGMRGGNFPASSALDGQDFPSLIGGGDTYGRNMYSASHITDRYGVGMRSTEAVPFPPLAPPPAAPTDGSVAKASSTTTEEYANAASAAKKLPPKASKTLSKISGIVKKTSQDEKQRQWEAREAARKKAMMSNLTFGVDPFMTERPQGLLAVPPQAVTIPVISEEQLQRNRAFAEALGVKPATHRHYNSGWSRPTDGAVSFDEYGNELDAALYPEVLIAVARERMSFLLKLEKKWKSFLADDKAASLPLNPMDKPTRAFVHHYSDFWNLKTESFDPEPKRYIHCVKLPETRMPYPLLSDVASNWRGPLPDVSKINLSDHASHQTAGQTSKSRELPPPPDRVPLPLKPRSASQGVERHIPPAVTEKGGAGLLEANAPNAARSNALLGRERPKLDLAPRTVPLELPPYDPHHQQDIDDAAAYDAAEDLRRREARMAERKQREREAEEKKRQALEKAFASDDEEEERVNRTKIGGGEDSDSEWGDEQEAVYAGSDDEED